MVGVLIKRNISTNILYLQNIIATLWFVKFESYFKLQLRTFENHSSIKNQLSYSQIKRSLKIVEYLYNMGLLQRNLIIYYLKCYRWNIMHDSQLIYLLPQSVTYLQLYQAIPIEYNFWTWGMLTKYNNFALSYFNIYYIIHFFLFPHSWILFIVVL